MPEEVATMQFAPAEDFAEIYHVFEEIGTGQFAVVKRCVHKSTGVEYAAKFIRKRRVANSRRGAKRADIEREIGILRESSGHPNIVTLFEAYESPSDVILILELVTGGELFHYVYEREALDEQEAAAFVRQILLGLHHLHVRHVAHLDVKPENVMLQSKNGQRVKLIDFGLSRKITPGLEIRDMIGTPEFVAPEIVNYDCLSTSTDIWAVGVVTYILLSGLSPFMGETRDLTFCNISAVNYTFDDDRFAFVSETAKDFIRSTFVRDPRKRSSCEQMLRHSWLESKMDAFLLHSSESATETSKRRSIRKRWKNMIRVVVICNYLCGKIKANSLRHRTTKLYKKAETFSASVPSSRRKVMCSSSLSDVVQMSKNSMPVSIFAFGGGRGRSSWLAAPTTAFVVASSLFGCICLAFYSRVGDGYVCT